MFAAARAALRRAEGRLWTGPAAHLLGGALDVAGALLSYLRMRRRTAPAQVGREAAGTAQVQPRETGVHPHRDVAATARMPAPGAGADRPRAPGSD